VSFSGLRWLLSKVRLDSTFAVMFSLCVLFFLTIAVILTVIKPPNELIVESDRDLSIERVIEDALPSITFMSKVRELFAPQN